MTEGRIPYAGHSTWYRSTGGERDATPLLVLHGGPGDTSEYLAPYDDLAATGRRVVRYDQLGCGRSSLRDVPHAPDLWSIRLFVEEVDAVRAALGLRRVHLLGHSWGGQLALEYVLGGAEGVASLTLQSTLASLEEWTAETTRLLAALPPGDDLAERFARAHVLRLDEPPACWRQARTMVARDPEVYRLFVGEAEFDLVPTSPFVGWDLRPRLGEIEVPTLLLSGAHDEATPSIMGTLHRGIAGSEWHVLEHSSHNCQLEEPGRALVLVSDFLARVDARI